MNTQNPNMIQVLGGVQRDLPEGAPAGDKPKTWWTPIGVAFVNRDKSINVLLNFLPTRLEQTTIQLRDLDGQKTLADLLEGVTRLKILGAVQREAESGAAEAEKPKTWWTRIGAAFVNRDLSLNLRFDYTPTRLDRTTIQIRPFDPKQEEQEKQEEQAAEIPF